MPDPTVKFCQKDHVLPGKTGERARVVEVWDAGETTLLGVIHPTAHGLKFVSRYITNHPHLVVVDPGEPPRMTAAVIVTLEGLPVIERN